jgi:hypothetical protein
MPPKETVKLPKQFIDLVEKLSNAGGVSGAEGFVRAIVKEQLDLLKLTYTVDALGNVLVEHAFNVAVAPSGVCGVQDFAGARLGQRHPITAPPKT